MKQKIKTTFTLTKSAWKAWEWIADKYDIEEQNVLNSFIRSQIWFDTFDANIGKPWIEISGKKIKKSRMISEDVAEILSELAIDHSVSKSLVLETYIHLIKSSVLELKQVQVELDKMSIESLENACEILGGIVEMFEETEDIQIWTPIEEIREVCDKLESISMKLDSQKLIGLNSLHEA